MLRYVTENTCVTDSVTVQTGCRVFMSHPFVAAQLKVPRASCDLVARDGNWTRDFEWSVPGLRSYVRVLPSCLQSRNRSAACIDVNVPLLRGLHNRTLLLVGDSTSARTFEFACSWLGATARRAWLPRPPHQRGYRASFGAAEHLCEVPGGPVIGHFLHYGAVGPPYFDANPGSIGVSWVGNTTARQVREDLPSFCRATTACASGSPSLIVANSLLWDASNWAQHRSTPRTRKRANEEPTGGGGGSRVWRQCKAKGLASV